MSVLKDCYAYYEQHNREYGYPPKQIRLYNSELNMLKEETKWDLMYPCETPSPNTVYGMEIIVVGGLYE